MQNKFKYYTGVVGFPILFVLIIWIIFWLDMKFNLNLKLYGIYPRSFDGLIGIFFSPFLHSSLEHLINNSIPLFLLSSFTFFFYKKLSWRIIILGIFFSGLITWIIGRNSYHIGASGLIYVLMSFILFKGIFSKNFNLMALSLVVVFIYGSLVWYIFPLKQNPGKLLHKSGVWFKIANWKGNGKDIPFTGQTRRGRMTPDFKIAPFFEHVVANEGEY